MLLNVGGKTPKNWNFWGVNRTFKPERQEIQILITWKLLSRSRQNFYREYAPRMNLRGWSHGSPNKSKMAAAAIFNFRKMSITQRYLQQILWEDASRPCRDGHVTKSRNRKLIRVTSSNEGLKDKCIDLSDYNRYLNQIWFRTQILHYQHAGMAKFT